jgi:hypothetical protein
MSSGLGAWRVTERSTDAVAFFYACAILSLPVMMHAVARAGMAKAEFQDPYLKALGITLGLMPKSSQHSTPQ